MIQALLTGGPRDGKLIAIEDGCRELLVPVAPIGFPHYDVDSDVPLSVEHHIYRPVQDPMTTKDGVVLFAHAGVC